MYKIRFHLKKGIYYRHWQIKSKKSIIYINPQTHTLTLYNCTLVSQKATAQKVFKSGKKDVCGWIKCDEYSVSKASNQNNIKNPTYRIIYNPITNPEWISDKSQQIITGKTFHKLTTKQNKVYAHTPT